MHPPILVSWIGSGVLLGCYWLLRFVVGTDQAVAVSQVLFLSGPLLACAFAIGASVAAPLRSRARSIWSLLAVSMGLLLVSEVIYSWHIVFGSVDSLGLGVADVINVLALFTIVTMLWVIGGLARRGRRWKVLMGSNALVLMVAAFILEYTTLLRTLIDQLNAPTLLTLSAYPLMGVLLLSIIALVWHDVGHPDLSPPIRMILIAVCFYAVGLLLWPLWRLDVLGVQLNEWAEIIVNTLFLTGYLLAFLAAVQRIEDPASPWQGASAPMQRPPDPWIDIGFSLLAALTVLGSSIGALTADRGSTDQRIYVLALLSSAFVMSARTVLFARYDERIKKRLVTDQVTGAHNPRGFEAHVAEHAAAASRFGEGFVLMLADLHGFAELAVPGRSAEGDRLLAEVVDALSIRFAGSGEVFRLEGVRLAVIVRIAEPGAVADTANAFQRVVRTVDSGGASLDCTVGVASCPDDAIGQDAIVSRAQAALGWAMKHGQGHVVCFGDIAERALFADPSTADARGAWNLEMVRALSAAADARDPANHLHSRNVAALVSMLAELLGFDPDRIERVQIAGLLHDVGKIALRQTLPGGRGSRAVERLQLREHPELGSRMLESLEFPEVSRWVMHHHERWDGAGYPDALVGEMIPIESRMIALANHYDSRISGAHYGAPMSRDAALQDIDLGIGTRFDPVLAQKFIEMVSSVNQGLRIEGPTLT